MFDFSYGWVVSQVRRGDKEMAVRMTGEENGRAAYSRLFAFV